MYSKEQEIALEAIQRAAKVTTSVYAELVEAAAKAGREPVTIADFASQAIINVTLREAFPNDAILGEEHASDFERVLSVEQREQVRQYTAKGLEQDLTLDEVKTILTRENDSSSRRWIVDPIDGTKGFLGKRAYAIAIALMENDQLVFGALGCPNLSLDNIGELTDDGVIFYATRGQGAFYQPLTGGEAIKMSVSDSLASDDLHLVTSYESGHSNKGIFNDVVQNLPASDIQTTGLDGQGKYGLVADGRVTAYFRLVPEANYREKVWDHAGGTIIVEEAGGRVTDFHGKPLDYTQGAKLTDNRGIVVSNGHIHDALLAAIQQTNWEETL